jgi:hypothetical protein
LDLPKLKLSDVETLRFEKAWLKDASALFIQRMDPLVSKYVAAASDDIANDVLLRYLPRLLTRAVKPIYDHTPDRKLRSAA